jgi:NADP-dependent 3-hydroxy acid dehydrogenase YdfG
MEKINNFLTPNIKGKSVVVTGGTTGIGRATVELLISLGCRVFTFGRDKDDFKKAMDEIKSLYPDCELYGTTADVSKVKDVEKIFKLVDKHLGEMDILINNAAISGEGVTKGGLEEWKYIIDTNISGYLFFAGEAVKRMSGKKTGHIINIGSMSADTKEKNASVYVATKSAIRGFTAALRKEVNPMGIRVSLIEPGAVTSDMQPGSKADHRKKIKKMKMLEATDIAMSILFCLVQPERCAIVSMQVRPFLQAI